ncbi:hypothetical protein PAXRUDRAFT_830303 [Paxillus rubicundulus Ve08.2h10]|uniref:Uncharacterized protein n=1 Tax=Paxillus rubicundulus Ve08.2h10 TaxID=930991 RepID=A0A0D0D5T4_9AGAM|nr:hypothetical protein PAXRUDRAFT_830303 [Paxillus rubicundulus Ve08.2h10]
MLIKTLLERRCGASCASRENGKKAVSNSRTEAGMRNQQNVATVLSRINDTEYKPSPVIYTH